MIFDTRFLNEVAVEYCDAKGQSIEIRYAELFSKAVALRDRIQNDFPEKIVGIQTQNTPELFIFILGLFLSGKSVALFHPRFTEVESEKLAKKIACPSILNKDKLIYYCNIDCPDVISEDKIPEFWLDSPEIASIVFTSGSTGEPKAIAHSFRNHYFSALGAHEHLPFEIGDRWAASLPMCHVGGLSLFFRALLKGGSIIFLDEKLKFPEAIEKTKATHLSLVPTQLQILVGKKTSFLETLFLLLIGGAAISDSLFQTCVDRKIPISLTYGMTESASQFATGRPFQKHVGQPLNYREIKIEDGKIFISGQILFEGYIEKGELIPFKDTWLDTGDLGFFDSDCNLHITGRADNMFISGGENIHPEYIENIILGLGICTEAMIVPVKDKKYGERPFLFVNIVTSIDIINNALKNKLAKFMWPVGVEIFPKESGLKRSRSKLKRHASEIRGS